MNELDKAELERYFSPIYYVEYEEMLPGELFPHVTRFGFYHERAKKEALEVFARNDDAKRVIEKSMRTGAEKVIKERESA